MSFRVLSHIKRSIFVRSRWGCLRKRCANKKLLRLPIFPIFLSLVRLYTYYIYYYHTTTYLLILNACILFLLYFLFSHLFSSFVVFEKTNQKGDVQYIFVVRIHFLKSHVDQWISTGMKKTETTLPTLSLSFL